ncbi:hypothetical protein DYB32_010120, partial [Aphanomyces invadans]
MAKSPKPSEAAATTPKNEFRNLYMNPRGSEVHGPFCSNIVITSKYTVWSFLPKFTVESFAKLANAYFLVVSALQCIPAITNTGGCVRSLTEAEVLALHGRVECEVPNKAISRFAGSFFVDLLDGSVANDPISIKNILLRGCQLRNTEWMYGLVLNTGPDTKIMQSSAKPVAKWSSINGQVNRMIQWLLLLLVLLCAASATAFVIWDDTYNAYPCATTEPPTCYMTLETNSAAYRWFVGFGQYFLLMYQIIPVSLYVTISTVMFLQAIFMAMDLDMYFEDLDARMIVRSMGL